MKQHKPNTAEDLLGFIQTFQEGDEYVEFRPRTSNSEKAWEGVEENHLWSIADNNYRYGGRPRLRLHKGSNELETPDGASISLADAAWVVRKARAAYRSKEDVSLREFDDDNPTQYDIQITGRTGHTMVGCKEFTFEEVQAIAKQFGLK